MQPNAPMPQAPAPAPAAPAAPMMSGGMQPMGQPPMMAGGGMPPVGGQPYADGGMTDVKKNPIKDFFSDINMVEAGLLALGVATFLYAIYYYKFEMNMTKTGYADLNARVQKLESDNEKRKAAEKNANAAGNLRSRRRLVM